MRRIFWILITPTIILLLLIVSVENLIFPRVSSWAISKVQEILEEEAKVQLSMEKSRLSILRLSVFMDEVKISGNIPGIESPAAIQSLQVRLDPLSLFLAEVRVSAIIIDNIDVKIDIDQLPKDNKPTETLPIEEIFEWAQKIPIDRVAIRRSQLTIKTKKHDLETQIRPLDSLITNHGDSLSLRLYAPSILFKSSRFPDPAGVSFESLIVLEPQLLRLQSGQIMSLGQTLLFSGEIENPKHLMTRPSGDIQVNLSSDLEPLTLRMRNFFGNEFPELRGMVRLESEFHFNGGKNLKGFATVNTQNVQIAEFQAGSLNTHLQLNGDKVNFEKLSVTHPSGIAEINKGSISLNAPYEFQGLVKASHLDLQELFRALDLHKIPVWLKLQGELPCKGQGENFFVECTGEIRAQDLLVKSGVKSNEPVIVAVGKGQANGQVRIDSEKVILKTQLSLEEAQGTVEGEVGYKTGFHYRFKTESMDFATAKELVGLDFKGVARLEGSTQGNSDAATLEIKMRVKDFSLEDFYLGEINGLLRYAKGHLYLSDIAGKLPKTTYTGDLDIDLIKDRLSGWVDFPQTDLSDVRRIFQDFYLFPLDIQGPGRGRVDFSGPFDFWKMSYNLTSQFNNGRIHSDSFTQLDFNVKSEDGLIDAENVLLTKSASQLRVTGQIDTEQNFHLKFEGNNWRLEESELVTQIKNDLAGALNFTGDLSGDIRQPELKLRGHLAEIIVNEQEVPSSFFDFRITKNSLEGQANLFGSKIQGDFEIPFVPKRPLRLRAKTVDWGFASILTLLGASELQDEYKSQITSDIDLASESGDFTEMSGLIDISEFYLERGHSSVKNEKPIAIQFSKGHIDLKDFLLTGPNTKVQVQGNNFTLNRLNLNIHAESDLRLAHILVPFLEDLGGPFHLQGTISGSYLKPEILGNAKIENTFVKLKGFPHPVEKMKADVIFSQTRILIQNIRGYLGGGSFLGEGSVAINGINDIPTVVRIRADGLTLNVPDKVKTQGSAQLVFSGNWFPFVLGGTYNVTSGFIEKEFTEGATSAVQVKDSIYLPKILKEGSFDPVVLDMQVNLDRNVTIKNSQMDGMITGQLQVKGPPNNPILLGKISVDRNSKLMFKDKIFEVQTGSVTFNNPNEINPELYLTAQSRVSDYDVSLLVQGQSKDPMIRLSSVPPLPEPEIISLLALGVTSEKLEQSQSRDQATQLGYEAGSVLLNQSPINRFFESKLGGKLEFTSSFDSTKNVNIPKLTFRKKISRKWSTSVSRGVGTEQNPTEVKLQYQINNNLSAIGSWEGREAQEGTAVRSGTQESQSVFGLDLEFKREFK